MKLTTASLILLVVCSLDGLAQEYTQWGVARRCNKTHRERRDEGFCVFAGRHPARHRKFYRNMVV